MRLNFIKKSHFFMQKNKYKKIKKNNFILKNKLKIEKFRKGKNKLI